MSCGGKRNSEEELDVPIRNGSELGKLETKNFDGLPKLSAANDAGSVNIVFVSGKAMEGDAKYFRIFKSIWETGKAPSEPELLTSATTGHEVVAEISPDGLWVVVKVSKSGRTDLFLQDFAGTSEPVQMTDDELSEGAVAFSPDSKFVAFVTLDPAEGSKIKVMEIGAGDAAAVGEIKTLEPEVTVGSKDMVTFLASDTGYKLVVASRESLISTTHNLSSFEFADAAAVETATPKVVVEGLLLDTKVPMSSSGNQVMVVKRSLRSELRTATIAGDKVYPTPVRVVIRSEAAFINTDDGEITVFDSPPGIEVKSGRMGADSTAFYSIVDFYRCKVDKSASHTQGMIVAKTDSSNLFQRVVPRLNFEKTGWESMPAANYCDLALEPSGTSRFDDKITYMTASPDSTEVTYRVAYISSFSTAFDKSCVLKSGDQEINLIDHNAGTSVFYKLWTDGNQQTLESDATTCVL
jgi:hypothetical protein